MREACDSGVTRARGVNGRDIGRLCAERTAIVEANGAGSTHGHDDPGDIGEAGIRGERGAELVHIVGGKARAQKAVDLGQIRLDQLGLNFGLKGGLERSARGIEQHLGAGVLGNARDLGIVVCLDTAGQRTRDGDNVGLARKLGKLGGKGIELLGGNRRAALEQLGLVAGVEDVEANTSLALDGHKVVVNTVGVHELSHVGAHVAAEQTGCHNVVAQLTQHTGHVEALAASGLFGRHTVNVVDNELIELIARIDRRVHRNGEDHF